MIEVPITILISLCTGCAVLGMLMLGTIIMIMDGAEERQQKRAERRERRKAKRFVRKFKRALRKMSREQFEFKVH